MRLRTLAEVVDHLGSSGTTGIVDGAEIRVRRPVAGRKDRDKFISGKSKQNAVKTMVVTGEDGSVLFCSPTRPGSADIAHARQLGLVKLLADGPAVEILVDAGHQGLGAQTGGRVITPPPHRKFKKNAPDWCEEMPERRRKAHSLRRIRVEHGIAHLKNWRAFARHLGRREHTSDTVQAVAALLSHQQTADLAPARQV